MLPVMGLLLELAGVPRLPFADIGLMSKDEADLLLSFASKVIGQPVTAESVTFSPHLQPIVFWSLSAAPVMIPFLAFNRLIRGTIGPLFINLGLMMLLGRYLSGFNGHQSHAIGCRRLVRPGVDRPPLSTHEVE
jgi:hypothetical protein